LLIESFEAGFEHEHEEEDDDEPEDKAEPPLPHETLRRLMDARKLELSDVEHLLGNVHLAREVLAGKRPISRGQAKELGKFFQVPPKLFY
jgi:HTH-type transcriptional regulator/antitoxin HigA